MKNLIGIVLLVAGIIAAYFIFNKEETKKVTTTEELKDFAIEDTAAVDKIFMSQPNGKKVLLSRRETGTWLVNGKFPARPDAINLILKTLHDIQIQGNVAQENFEHTVKRLATASTKVEYYAGGAKPEKVWYIGDATASRMGTYMLLEKKGVKSSKPYVTHLLTERGYLSSRFFLDPVLWKNRVMMKVNPKKIKSIEVKHAYDTATSFKIEKVDESKFNITNLKTGSTEELSPNKAIPYFKEFGSVFYEYIDVKTPKEELDSIYNSPPRHIIHVKTEEGKEVEMRTYNLPVLPGSTTASGKPIYFHNERMYAYTSELGETEHAIVQNLTFDKLVPRLEDFESSTTVEK